MVARRPHRRGGFRLPFPGRPVWSDPGAWFFSCEIANGICSKSWARERLGFVSAIGLICYMVFLQAKFHDPLAFMHGQTYWNVGLNWERIRYASNPVHALAQVLYYAFFHGPMDWPHLWESLCVIWPPIVLLLLGGRYLSFELELVGWMLWGLPYISNSMAGGRLLDTPWMSMGRFMAVLLPVYIIAGGFFALPLACPARPDPLGQSLRAFCLPVWGWELGWLNQPVGALWAFICWGKSDCLIIERIVTLCPHEALSSVWPILRVLFGDWVRCASGLPCFPLPVRPLQCILLKSLCIAQKPVNRRMRLGGSFLFQNVSPSHGWRIGTSDSQIAFLLGSFHLFGSLCRRKVAGTSIGGSGFF